MAVIAGGGSLPAEAVRQMVLRGHEVHAVRVVPGGAKGLRRAGAARCWSARLSELDGCVRLLLGAGCSQAVVVGKVAKSLVFSNSDATRLAEGVVERSADGWGDRVILAAIARVLGEAGIEVLRQTDVLSDWVCPSGILTSHRPTDSETRDAQVGLSLAQGMAGAGIGQTVVVKRGVVLAVEACEGTDAAVRRGARIGRGGAVVAKASAPDHDFRFDVPTVGCRTLRIMRRWGARVLALEAGRTLIAQPAKFLAEAHRLGIAVVGIPLRGGVATDSDAALAGGSPDL